MKYRTDYRDKSKAHIPDNETYTELYNQSIENPKSFWDSQGNNLTWFNKWHTVKNVDKIIK